MSLKKVAISIGDLNGIGLEIALRAHEQISKLCSPIYCIDENMLDIGAKLLSMPIPSDFECVDVGKVFEIKPSIVDKKSGKYSYLSFLRAIDLVNTKQADAIVTLPIHKKAWQKAGLKYHGHTEVLRDIYKQDAIMMLGCEEMFVALFTEHIALKDVVKSIKTKRLERFFMSFYSSTLVSKVGVLALNPHAGDDGVMGDEEATIVKAIKNVNMMLDSEVFVGVLVPDTAFAPINRKNFTHYIAMYHDQGLVPLKALYFDESINVSLNLPIIRTSVDHGTGFDIAYGKGKVNITSYINAIKYAIKQYGY